MKETWIRSLGGEDPLEKETETHSIILACKIPWTEELGGLQSMESQRVRHACKQREGCIGEHLAYPKPSELLLYTLLVSVYSFLTPQTPPSSCTYTNLTTWSH